MKYKEILTKEFLEREYWVKYLSILQIAKEVGCSREIIRWYLKKYNISRRTQSEAMKGNKNGLGNKNMLGKHHTEETKRKISEANSNPSEVTKRRKSEKMKGNKNAWKGGKRKDREGYIHIYELDHIYANCGYVLEHRLIVEKYLRRYLKPTEVVHHINEIRDDNRIDNLMVFASKSAHRRWHINQKLVKPREIIFDGRVR